MLASISCLSASRRASCPATSVCSACPEQKQIEERPVLRLRVTQPRCGEAPYLVCSLHLSDCRYRDYCLFLYYYPQPRQNGVAPAHRLSLSLFSQYRPPTRRALCAWSPRINSVQNKHTHTHTHMRVGISHTTHMILQNISIRISSRLALSISIHLTNTHHRLHNITQIQKRTKNKSYLQPSPTDSASSGANSYSSRAIHTHRERESVCVSLSLSVSHDLV